MFIRLDTNPTIMICDNKKQTRLRDFNMIASLPCKSSKHIDIFHTLVMCKHVFTKFHKNVIMYLPADPEFVLEAQSFSLATPDAMTNFIFTLPPFHIQKHCLEILEKNIVISISCRFNICTTIFPRVSARWRPLLLP